MSSTALPLAGFPMETKVASYDQALASGDKATAAFLLEMHPEIAGALKTRSTAAKDAAGVVARLQLVNGFKGPPTNPSAPAAGPVHGAPPATAGGAAAPVGSASASGQDSGPRVRTQAPRGTGKKAMAKAAAAAALTASPVATPVSSNPDGSTTTLALPVHPPTQVGVGGPLPVPRHQPTPNAAPTKAQIKAAEREAADADRAKAADAKANDLHILLA
jgi:hypothetical protein